MDLVFIQSLEVRALIGVHEWERRVRQPLRIDLELGTDTRTAGASDDLEHAIDYAAVADRIRRIADASAFHLIEALAETLADALQGEFGVGWLRLRITKPGAVAGAAGVGVVIERSP